MVATGQHPISSGSVRFFPQVLKLTSCGKKSLDIARSRHVNQGRFGKSHLLQRVSISLTYTGTRKLSGRLVSPLRSSKMQDGMIISPSTSQGAYLQLKKLHILLGIQHTYLRAEDSTLGISFNAQSQAPDIPNISSRAAIIEYTLSLNATQNDPDISRLPLRGLQQELSVSLSTQSQAPDDPFHAQDSSCAPRDSLYNSPSISQALQMLPTRIFTAPFLPQTVSQDLTDLTHLPPSRIQKTPYQGFWRSEVHFLRRLRIRFVRQDLACVYSDGFGCCFLIWVCFFNDSRWSIIHTILFVSFA
jgi:hypothetical protein